MSHQDGQTLIAAERRADETTWARRRAWLRERLLPRGADTMMVVAYAMIVTALIVFVLQAPPIPAWRFYGTIIALGLLLIANLTLPDLERALDERRSTIVFYGSSALLVLAANGLGLSGSLFTFLPFLLFLLAGQAFTNLPLRVALPYILAVLAGWIVTRWLHGAPVSDLIWSSAQLALGLIFTLVFGLVLRRYGEQTERAESLLRALQAARERERDLAAADERVRLAREIHDGLGHHLTVLNVQLQAAEKLIERDPERARDAIALCREEAQAALLEVRQSVAAMRRTPLDGRSLESALAALVRDFDRHSPMAATFESSGDAPALSPQAAMTLYRAAQEGLTNAQKHAAAQRVIVRLDADAMSARLTVEDDGQGAPASDGGGFGLAGLRERAEQLGGTLAAAPLPSGGFRLELALPRDSTHDS
jgi:signal transduction histidine kinase